MLPSRFESKEYQLQRDIAELLEMEKAVEAQAEAVRAREEEVQVRSPSDVVLPIELICPILLIALSPLPSC